MLVYREVQHYRTPTWISSITVDTRPIPEQHHITMGIDLTLPGMRCDGEQYKHKHTAMTGKKEQARVNTNRLWL